MDAISFVFGLPAKYLRGKQLKDLIYNPGAAAPGGDAALVRPRKCAGLVLSERVSGRATAVATSPHPQRGDCGCVVLDFA